MDEQKDILLAKWMDRSISSDELNELSLLVDLAYLESIMEQTKLVDLETKPADQMWEDFNFPAKVAHVPKRNFLRWLILGILALIAVLALLFYNPNKTVSTSKTERQIFAFEDGSKAYLSPNSQITFDEDNYANKRSISMKGHVFFEVEKGNPFTVNMPSGSVQVLGTSFDIWNIDEAYCTVDCYEGKVKVIESKSRKEQIISAGQGTSLNKNQEIGVTKLSRKRPDWLDNQRIYEGIPVNLFLEDLSRYYNVTFRNDGVNFRELISGSYPTDDLEKLIKTIEVSNQWKHEKIGEKITFQSSE